MSISISLFCFSTSVSMTASKTFTGGGSSSQVSARKAAQLSSGHDSSSSPPPFTLPFSDQMSLTQWQTYVSAFETE
jgi:hypothetical protein